MSIHSFHRPRSAGLVAFRVMLVERQTRIVRPLKMLFDITRFLETESFSLIFLIFFLPPPLLPPLSALPSIDSVARRCLSATCFLLSSSS